jgi:hypothetical protein
MVGRRERKYLYLSLECLVEGEGVGDLWSLFLQHPPNLSHCNLLLTTKPSKHYNMLN